MSLEERLKATFTLGEVSETTTPNRSGSHSPNPSDPILVPLPLSPPLDPTEPADLSIDGTDVLSHSVHVHSNALKDTVPPAAEQATSERSEHSTSPRDTPTSGEPSGVEHVYEQLRILEKRFAGPYSHDLDATIPSNKNRCVLVFHAP